MRELDKTAVVVANENRHGTLMEDKSKIAEIIGNWVGEDPKCQVANLVPLKSRSGRTFLHLAKESAEAPNLYYLLPARLSVAASVMGYELFDTDDPEWIIMDLRMCKTKQIAFGYEADNKQQGLCIVDVIYDRVYDFATVDEYDLWLNDHVYNDTMPIPQWQDGKYTFPDGTWKELKVESSKVGDLSDHGVKSPFL